MEFNSWNNAQEANQDEEGKQTMRVLARNMTFLMKSIALGKEAYGCRKKKLERVRILFVKR